MGLFDKLFSKNRADEATVAPPLPISDYESTRKKAKNAGSVRGKHFSEWAPEIDRLRAAGDLDASLVLAFECIDATERQAAVDGLGVAPAYYEDAAIAYRKQKRYADEVAVLERYLAGGRRHPEFEDRRNKAAALRDAETNAAPLACPACGEVLSDPPKSRGKCPSCRETLVMRTVAGQRVAFTPEQATQHAAADKAAKRRASFLKRLGYFDVTAAEWDRTHAEQAARFGRPSSDGDVYWQIANEVAVRYEQEGTWLLVGRVRSDMTKFSVEEGRDWVGPARVAEQAWAMALQQFDSPRAEMILIACPCRVCQRDHLQVRSLGDFVAAWPLPHADCERIPCRCRVTRRTY